MKTAMRAYRILSVMTNFHKAELANSRFVAIADGRLGELLGCYRNPDPQEEIGVSADGLAWFGAADPVALRFVDIVRVDLSNGKESESLVLEICNGRQILMPVRGQRGQFYDSMEVLRFMCRVLEDSRKSEKGETLPP